MGCIELLFVLIVIAFIAFIKAHLYLSLALVASYLAYHFLTKRKKEIDTLPARSAISRYDMMSGSEFEYAMAELLRENGYSRVTVTQQTGDDGLDIIAYRGGFKTGFQCKRFNQNVGNSAVQQAYAGKTMYNCDSAAVITNTYFTQSAKETARKLNVELWDRNKLQSLSRNAVSYKSSELKWIQAGRLVSAISLISLICIMAFIAVKNNGSDDQPKNDTEAIVTNSSFDNQPHSDATVSYASLAEEAIQSSDDDSTSGLMKEFFPDSILDKLEALVPAYYEPEKTASAPMSSSESTPVEPTVPFESPAETPAIISALTTTEVKMRSAPDSKQGDGNVLKYLHEGTSVTVLDENGDFLKVEYDGLEGFIHKDYLLIADNDDNSHDVSEDQTTEAPKKRIIINAAHNEYDKRVDRFLCDYNEIAEYPIKKDMVVSERIEVTTTAVIEDSVQIYITSNYSNGVNIELSGYSGHEYELYYSVLRDTLHVFYPDAPDQTINDFLDDLIRTKSSYYHDVYFSDIRGNSKEYKGVFSAMLSVHDY